MEADMEGVLDRGETVSQMEPLRFSQGSRHRPDLIGLVVDLAAASAGLRESLPPGIAPALAELVRAMNCYYSNLIEGHDTHPVDIERAMKNDYSADAKKRDLQLEAKAHVAVQAWIDCGGLSGKVVAKNSICDIHRRFCEQLPQELLKVRDPDTNEELQAIPGEFRHRDVRVGTHIAVSPGAVPRFMDRFETVYGGLARPEIIVAAAAAHHRLVWIHPFLDGNGRVARLMSHAVLLEALDTGSLWSIARGLARNVDAYKQHLRACDGSRRNGLDGRGALSEEALAGFTRFFLETCLDQVRFMKQLVQPNRLRERILLWAEEEVRVDGLPAKAGQLLEAVLFRGELPRKDIPTLLGMGERQSRRVVSTLLDRGVLVSETPRAPLSLAFPAALAPRWMPGLFPEKTD